MAEKVRDKFSNKFFGEVTESAAATLTFHEIPTNLNTFDKVAWVLHRLEWYIPYATLALLVDTGDKFDMALVASDKVPTLELSDPGVIDLMTLSQLLRSSIGYTYHEYPLVRDFGDLPGGGLIIAPRPLFLALKGTGTAAAGTVSVRGYFTQIELAADDYIELVDFYRILQ